MVVKALFLLIWLVSIATILGIAYAATERLEKVATTKAINEVGTEIATVAVLAMLVVTTLTLGTATALSCQDERRRDVS